MKSELTSAIDENLFVFYGALRSGTTLVRLMFDAHPDVFCPGERDFLFDYIGQGQSYDLKQLAANRIFQSARLTLPDTAEGGEALRQMLAEDRAKTSKKIYVLVLHRGLEAAMQALPNAKFIHLLRDPRDVASSSIGMGWAGNTWYGVDHWLRTELEWDRAMTAERTVLDLRYEELLAEPEQVLTQVCSFFGVEFDSEMLNYDQNSSYSKVNAALAYQWLRKQNPQEVSELEFKLGDLLVEKGYARSAAGPAEPRNVRRLALFMQNKYRIWAHRFNRYGFFDPIWSACVRHLGIRHLATRARQRMNEHDRAHLK